MSEFEESGFAEGSRKDSLSETPAREGLPPGFRMRADAHYVDLITSRRSEGPRDTAKPATKSRGADWDGDLGLEFPPEARVVDRDVPLSHLTDDLATIQGAAALLANDASPLVRRVSLDLINMHASRAAWRLRADEVLSTRRLVDRRGCRLGALLTQIREALAPACRLNNVGLQIHASNWESVVSVDADVLEVGLTGAVLATIGLVRSDEWAAIRIHATDEDGELRTIDVIQEEVSVPEGLGRRFFDAANIDRPGGWAASLGAATAKAAAKLHGGDAMLVAGERRGSTLRLTL